LVVWLGRPASVVGKSLFSKWKVIPGGKDGTFWKEENKIEFDARKGLLPKEITDPSQWEYIHNFKVHYKISRIQAIATKVDISLPSKSAAVPTLTEVTAEADKRLTARQISGHVRTSYHITNIEYKESLAIRMGFGSLGDKF